MEKFTPPINKGDRRAIHLKPNEVETLPVRNGIDYNLDTLHLKYDNKYSGIMVTFTYSDANGHKVEYGKNLENGGIMNIMNDEPIDSPNFANIGFSSRQEIFFEFSVS